MLWLFFASANTYLTFLLAGEETIPYHLVWASFALVYGLFSFSRRVTWTTFSAITVTSAIALIQHATSGIIGWSEVSEVVLMGALLALLIWHVDRHRATQQRLVVLQQDERHQAQQREIASKFGTHEVRTRLAIARGFVELMQSATDDPGMRKDAELVLEELDKASVLVTNLLTLVRFGTPTATVPVDVESLVESVKNRWVAAADREWSCDSFSGFIEGDPERLEAALDCLIENAVKFTQVGDSISITGRLDGLEMTISVRDSGAGIPEQDLDRIFDVFQTSSSAGDLAGSGLGLPIVRAIVEARHGSLTVESAVGVGTCFTLRVPVPYGVTGPDPTSSFPASRQDPMVASLPLSS